MGHFDGPDAKGNSCRFMYPGSVVAVLISNAKQAVESKALVTEIVI